MRNKMINLNENALHFAAQYGFKNAIVTVDNGKAIMITMLRSES